MLEDLGHAQTHRWHPLHTSSAPSPPSHLPFLTPPTPSPTPAESFSPIHPTVTRSSLPRAPVYSLNDSMASGSNLGPTVPIVVSQVSQAGGDARLIPPANQSADLVYGG